jgi:uncharacterized protein (DUF2236 family)
MPLFTAAGEPIRRALGDRLRATVSTGEPFAPRPPDDPGLFGHESIARIVHADLTAMMVGGVASLLLQMLHPAALAGVWDHSDFRRDRHGRLKRTARFIAVTTYGSTEDAEATIARIRRIHERVAGALPDGTAYAASDPALLRWVHIAETWAFLGAHRRYRAPGMPIAEQDRYCAEMAIVAEKLGATDVPRTRAQLDAALVTARAQLRYDARTATVARTLLARTPGTPAGAHALLIEGAIDLLPAWAAALHGLDRPLLTRPALRLGVAGLGRMVRWALQPAG